MNYKTALILAISSSILSACAPTDYMDKNPDSLPNHEKIWGYDQAAENHNYASEVIFLKYFKSKLTPNEYLMFFYLSSPGVGVDPGDSSLRSWLTGAAMRFALESNRFPLFNHNGSSSIYCQGSGETNSCKSRIIESGNSINNKIINMASNLAKKGDLLACQFLYVENAGKWLLQPKASEFWWPSSVNIPRSKIANTLEICAHDGVDSKNIEHDVKQYSYKKDDTDYDKFFYAHTNHLINNEREQAENTCAGVKIPNPVSFSLIQDATQRYRLYHGLFGRYEKLKYWKNHIYRKWKSSMVESEIQDIEQDGMPVSIKETPIVAQAICNYISSSSD